VGELCINDNIFAMNRSRDIVAGECPGKVENNRMPVRHRI